MEFSNLSKFPDMHTGFQILRCTKFDIPNSSGKYQKPRIYLSLELDFYFGNSCDADKSTLYVPGSPYLVHSCASDVIWWMAKHYCQVRAGLGPRLQRHKCQVRAGLGPRLLWVNIATELITRYYSNETLIQCCFNVRQTSVMLAQIEPTLDKSTMFERKSSYPANTKHLYNIYTTRPKHCIKSYKCFVFTGCQYKLGVRQFPHPRSNTVSLFPSQGPSRGQG